MSDFIINNKCVLNGEISVSGSKNAALPIMAACILVPGKTELENIPTLSDISIMTGILQSLGASVGSGKDMIIDASFVNKISAPSDLCTRIRASFLIAGPLLARFKRAEVPLPGGCRIGSRPVDLHLKGFKALGAEVTVTTVDGSYGLKGFVTDALKDIDYTYFYTCGPEPMLKAVFKATTTSGQMSFEERMGCGFGACMGCSCKTLTGYKRICKEGPVMKKEEILW